MILTAGKINDATLTAIVGYLMELQNVSSIFLEHLQSVGALPISNCFTWQKVGKTTEPNQP